ncbi:MarR family winged helix-turn-helix transcriptional regulator [Phytoactinopolyspora halotolerans]|uniref:MarR family transcriptional regulator n=1 Tax=Phytoactinopolyspora halotolerans TaxID=1981512 RepID=A0A6L9S4T4_9ACTN|nr:MarR family transcriptional regulator [Phytoactinopolyspora halotolerans]NEE00129.1 MarR family transcriptional regulator [Phytoactinopolyspora halotolerans]
MELNRDATPTVLSAEAAEVLAAVPLIEAYFRRSNVKMSEALSAVFAEHGLTARHGAVLAQLVVAAPLAVGELARVLGVSLSTASELVSDLARSGIAVRREDPQNRRRTLVELADVYLDDVRELVAGRAEPLVAALAELSPRDREGFANGLRAWAAQIRT